MLDFVSVKNWSNNSHNSHYFRQALQLPKILNINEKKGW
jgi:hypothetical protein